jgi:UDPglucose--hexose-1-phosphate uridylyltransferase
MADPPHDAPGAATGELRFDRLTRDWVNIVGHRQARPNLPSGACPFCVGGLEAPDPYTVRAFPNRWPPMVPGDPLAPPADPVGARVAARGAAEVVLYSPEHHASLASLGVQQVRQIVDLWSERTEALLARPEVAYVLVFENRGPEVGATIHHPHGQIYGFPFVPPVPRRLLEVAAVHGDPVAGEVADEVAAGSRVVVERGPFVAYVPFASAYPFGLRIVPQVEAGRLADLDGAARADLAAVLAEVVARYDGLFPQTATREVPFPYLMWIHQAPEPRPAAGARLHVQLAPPWRAPGVARFVASGEIGSGTPSNPVTPEDAAAALRAVRLAEA